MQKNLCVYNLKFLQAEGHSLFCKQRLCFPPGFCEEGGISVLLETFRCLPAAVCVEHGGMVGVSHQFKFHTAREVAYLIFHSIEQKQELIHGIRTELHAYHSQQGHISKIQS